jgi:hypothetical protein
VIGHVATDGLRTVPGRLVAAHAIRRVQRVVVVDVALCAGCRGMCAYQCETCDAVIEGRSIPSLRGVAVGAVRRRECRSGS